MRDRFMVTLETTTELHHGMKLMTDKAPQKFSKSKQTNAKITELTIQSVMSGNIHKMTQNTVAYLTVANVNHFMINRLC